MVVVGGGRRLCRTAVVRSWSSAPHHGGNPTILNLVISNKTLHLVSGLVKEDVARLGVLGDLGREAVELLYGLRVDFLRGEKKKKEDDVFCFFFKEGGKKELDLADAAAGSPLRCRRQTAARNRDSSQWRCSVPCLDRWNSK